MKVKTFYGSVWSKEEKAVEESVNDFIKDKKVIDIKYQELDTSTGLLVMYEEPSVIQETSFFTYQNGDEINKFLATHDIVKTDHTTTNGGEIITTVTYKENKK